MICLTKLFLLTVLLSDQTLHLLQISFNYTKVWKVERDSFGKANGKQRNTKKKMTGVLLDVLSKIN